MDNKAQSDLVKGAASLGVTLSAEAAERLLLLRDELLRWNQKVNLTAITAPDEVLEKHLLDSLAIVPLVPEGARVLDVGSGAGFPGLPLALCRPDLRVTMVDAVAKKVGFIKAMAAKWRLGPRAEARHLRLAGEPQKEGLGPFDVAVARALMDLPPWLLLARAYLVPGGRALAMMGVAPDDAALEIAGRDAGLRLERALRFQLASSRAQRVVASFSNVGAMR